MLRALTFTIGFVLAGMSSAPAQARVYDGEQVEALRCAHLMTITSYVMWEEGYISEGQKRMMMSAALTMLDLYVSGTFEEKQQAMAVISDRRSLMGNFVEFEALGESCFQRFPIY